MASAERAKGLRHRGLTRRGRVLPGGARGAKRPWPVEAGVAAAPGTVPTQRAKSCRRAHASKAPRETVRWALTANTRGIAGAGVSPCHSGWSRHRKARKTPPSAPRGSAYGLFTTPRAPDIGGGVDPAAVARGGRLGGADGARLAVCSVAKEAGAAHALRRVNGSARRARRELQRVGAACPAGEAGAAAAAAVEARVARAGDGVGGAAGLAGRGRRRVGSAGFARSAMRAVAVVARVAGAGDGVGGAARRGRSSQARWSCHQFRPTQSRESARFFDIRANTREITVQRGQENCIG